MTGYFITGTSTGVGKTVVAALLTLGLDGNYWKPVQCGLDEGQGDRERVAAMTGLPQERFPREAYRLALPASPHLAAEAEGVTIRREKLAPPGMANGRPMVVEGAGGILVPLNWEATMLDLAAWLGLPAIVVAETRLGTINHTLLTLGALRGRGVEIAGVILNGAEAAGLEATLAHFGEVTLMGRVPPLAALTPAELRGAWQGLAL